MAFKFRRTYRRGNRSSYRRGYSRTSFRSRARSYTARKMKYAARNPLRMTMGLDVKKVSYRNIWGSGSGTGNLTSPSAYVEGTMSSQEFRATYLPLMDVYTGMINGGATPVKALWNEYRITHVKICLRPCAVGQSVTNIWFTPYASTSSAAAANY